MKRILSLMLAMILTMSLFASCAAPDYEETTLPAQSLAPGDGDDFSVDNEIGAFRPVDCTIPALNVYEYPFLGLTFTLTDAVLEGINTRDIFAWTYEDYTVDEKISYALLRFSAPTQAQKEEEGMSVDIFSWEEALAKVGAIGVYEKSCVSQLDALTLCDKHTKIGESSDGAYEYYLSIASDADSTMTANLEKTSFTLSQMHEIDLNMGYSAFSTDRIDGIGGVGTFTTEDVFGNSYDETVFSEYDLTLVNVFATWCSPCVREMPELEKLRESYAEKGIRFGVVAIVLDVKTANGIDEDARELAKVLHERSEAEFPFLLADDGNLNGRLTGIESIPESFFVDSFGNIVSDPYVGARDLSDWQEIVDSELASLGIVG